MHRKRHNSLTLLLAAWFLSAASAWADPGRTEPKLWFPVGEKLEYRIFWGVIPVGTSVATTEWVEEGDRKLLAIRFRNRSNKFLDAIYPVDDLIESLIDPETFLPVRFTLKMREGRHHKDEVTTFDYDAGMAHWTSFVRNKTKQYPIDTETRDLVSFMYYMRGQSEVFEEEGTREFKVLTDDKIYNLLVKPLKTEKISVGEYGKVEAVRFEPEATFDGLFVRKGKLWLWVSDDERRIVTKAQASIPVASVKIVLDSVSGPGDDFWVADSEQKVNPRNEH